MEGDTELEKIENQRLNISKSLVTNVNLSLHPNTFSRPLSTVPTTTQAISLASCLGSDSSVKDEVKSSHSEMPLRSTLIVTTPARPSFYATSVSQGSQTSQTILTAPTQSSPSSIAIRVRKSSRLKPSRRRITTVPIEYAVPQSDTSTNPSPKQLFHIDNKRTSAELDAAPQWVSSTSPSPANFSHSCHKALPGVLLQCDGGDTGSEINEDSQYRDSEDEVDSATNRAALIPSDLQGPTNDMEKTGGEEKTITSANIVRQYSRNKQTTRVTTIVPMETCENNAEIVKNSTKPKMTSRTISAPFTQYEGLECDILRTSSFTTFGRNSCKENCDSNVIIVENNSIPQSSTGGISRPTIQYVASQCEVSNYASLESSNRIGYNENSDIIARGVRNNLKPTATTRVISFTTEQHEHLQCNVPSTSSSKDVCSKGCKKNRYALPQCDGADSASDSSASGSLYSDSEDEAESAPVRPVLVPAQVQGPLGTPLQLEVDLTGQISTPTCVPLCVVTNPRSGWNKMNNICTFLRQISPDVMILSEHWGRKRSFEQALQMQHFKVKESSRGIRGIPSRGRNGNQTVSVTGGGVAIIYTETNFAVEDAEIEPPEGVEAVWTILTPKNKEIETIKKILVGGIYISPRSKFKQETIDHIIESMFYVQSQHDFQVRYIIAGDFNKVDIQDILETNGALKQICSVGTRHGTTLEFIITDMATLFHPPTIKEPLIQDEGVAGKPSDHNVVIAAPRSDVNFKLERHKKKVQIRPRPNSSKATFIVSLAGHEWPEIKSAEDAHEKARAFHETLTKHNDKYFPVKTVKMTTLDKPWFSPALKLKFNEMQSEFFKNGKTPRWKSLRKIFRSAKKKACQNFNVNFVDELKVTNPGQFYKMAKRIGAISQETTGELIIECLEGLTPQEQVQKVAESFAAVSNEYEPVDTTQLPAYLPSEEPPQLQVYKVYRKIQSQKKTKSTFPIDIYEGLRKEAAEFLAEPLTEILNTCLKQGKFPEIWKKEEVTPVPKTKPNQKPKKLTDVRKIASTSDYSKIFESFILEFILEDISHNLNKRQFGGKKGTGTEHLIVSLIDRIKQALDDPEKVAVILKSYDWSGAFDRLDPTKVAIKAIKLGIRSSIVKVLIDFMNQRKMQVKMNGFKSTILDLVGGGPQGSILGQLLFIIGSDDAAQEVPDEDEFKYIDDLALTEIVKLEDKLEDYDVWQHVPSDVGIDQKFLPPNKIKSQIRNDQIQTWTEQNKMKINQSKSKYMVFTKTKESIATRLSLNQNTIERTEQMLHLGVWIAEDLTWNKHISEICKRAYPRIRMLTKLKYVGLQTEDLIDIYCKFIRSLTEYCSTSFHSSLSGILQNKLEAIQKTSLKVILGVMYISYTAALEMCGLRTLYMRREEKGLKFALKCTTHMTNKTMFPLNKTKDTHEIRQRETYSVNKSRTETYKRSTIPYLQRRLNEHIAKKVRLGEAKRKAAGARRRQCHGEGD